MLGNGPEYKRLRKTCTELRLDAIVHWLGDVSLARLAQEYNRASIFCLPSLQEGFGVVFLEAMAAGKPIVAARASVPEVVRHGILTDPESTESLAAGIETLYRNAGLCRSLGAAGRADVKRFDVHRVAASFISRMAKAVPAIKLEFPDTPVSDRAGAVIIQSASEDLHGGR